MNSLLILIVDIPVLIAGDDLVMMKASGNARRAMLHFGILSQCGRTRFVATNGASALSVMTLLVLVYTATSVL